MEHSHQASRVPSAEHRDFEFNLRELGGSMGDFGTLFPLAIGYIAVNGLDPAGLFIMLGMTNIALGLIYRMPMPVEPKKVIAVTAIAQQWTPATVYASGFGLGILWFVLVLTGLLRKLVAITPPFIVRGIQLALGVLLGWQALQMMAPAPLLGVLAVAIVLLLRQNRYAPASLVLMVLGVGIVAWQGKLPAAEDLTLTLPPLTVPRLGDIWQAMLLAGFAQIPLSITNAVIAPAVLIREYFPEKATSERKLMVNMGVMNTVASFFGGMPMCHGAGGFAGQYYFGARTGGAPIMEGLIEVGIGLFLSRSIASIVAAFPMALVGGMMLLVGIQLGKGTIKLRGWNLVLCLITAGLSVATNMAVGFLAGLALAYMVRTLRHRRVLPCLGPECDGGTRDNENSSDNNLSSEQRESSSNA